MNYLGAAVTDIGIVKSVNQDSLTLKIAHSPWGMVCMAVMCDGLGGLAQGEVASGNMILAFNRWFKESFLSSDREWTEDRIREDWEEIVFEMNQKIKSYGLQQGIELGTTLTVILYMKEKYYCLHIGDCRLYEIKHVCRLITRDQTLVEQELQKGLITAEEALKDNRRNVLLQCIGVTDRLKPDFISGRIEENTAYLLCSDGFRHMISEEELHEYCRPQKNLSQKKIQDNLEELTQLNKQRGERDNISAILIQIGTTRC